MKEDEDNKLKRVIVRGVAAIVRSVIIMIMIIIAIIGMLGQS